MMLPNSKLCTRLTCFTYVCRCRTPQVARAILALKLQEQQLIASKKQAMEGVRRRTHSPQQLQLQLHAPAPRLQQWGRQLQAPNMQQGSMPLSVRLHGAVGYTPVLGQPQQASLDTAAASAATWGSPY
jgi:hypothetical protein